MKFEGDEVIFESTGRREYTYGDAFMPNGRGDILYGSDGGICELLNKEILEVAKYMIDMWRRWASDAS